MVNCKKCHCYASNGVLNYKNNCQDVCINPSCGNPDLLTILAPVVYDEIGINLCRTIEFDTDISTTYPSAAFASIEVLDINFNPGGNTVTSIEPINGRPYCYRVTLTNLSISFLVNIYNCAKRLLASIPINEIYLSPDDTEYYNEETNPNYVVLEIFAPYGVAYNNNIPFIQYIGFTSTNNSLTQGLDMIAIPKILNFDLANNRMSVGLSIYLKSVYFSQYRINHQGKAIVPKATVSSLENNVCLNFVEGSLLDREIKPLELGAPKCEECLKQECSTNSCCNICKSTTNSGNTCCNNFKPITNTSICCNNSKPTTNTNNVVNNNCCNISDNRVNNKVAQVCQPSNCCCDNSENICDCKPLTKITNI